MATVTTILDHVGLSQVLSLSYDIHDIPVTKYNGSYMFESPALNNDKENMQTQQFCDTRIPCQGNWCEDYFRKISACHGDTYMVTYAVIMFLFQYLHVCLFNGMTTHL